MNWLYSYFWPTTPQKTEPQRDVKEQKTAVIASNPQLKVHKPATVAQLQQTGKTTPSHPVANTLKSVSEKEIPSSEDSKQYENINDWDDAMLEDQPNQPAVKNLKDQNNKFQIPQNADKKVNPYDLNYDTLRLGPTEDQVFAKKGNQQNAKK